MPIHRTLLALTLLAATLPAEAQRRRPPRNDGSQTPRTVEESIKAAEEKEREREAALRTGWNDAQDHHFPTKTRPPASECDRTNAGESACNKDAKCRGGDGFWAEESVPLSGRNGASPTRHIRAPHPRNCPSIPCRGAGAFRLTLLRKRALRPYIWPL